MVCQLVIYPEGGREAIEFKEPQRGGGPGTIQRGEGEERRREEERTILKILEPLTEVRELLFFYIYIYIYMFI